MTDDGLDIPAFLQRKLLTPEEQEAWRRESREYRSAAARRPTTTEKVNRDRQGRVLPRGMDAGSWALLAVIEKGERDAEKEDKAERDERFRVLDVQRKEAAALKRAAKEVAKAERAKAKA